MGRSIRARVLVLVGAAVFIAGGMLALLSRSSLLTLEESLAGSHARLASAVAAGVARAVDDDLRLLAQAAAAPHLNLADADDTAERAALQSLLRQARLGGTAFYVRADGRILVVEPARSGLDPEGRMTSAPALEAMSAQRPVVTDVIELNGRPAILAYVPFRATLDRPAGAVGLAVTLPDRELASLLLPDELGDGRQAELRDGGGLPLVVAAAHQPRDRMPAVRTLAQAPVARTPWTVTIVAVGDDPFAPIARFRAHSLWLAPGLAVFATILAWGIARSVRRPLFDLTEVAERIAQRELAQPIDTEALSSGGEEIARLATALEGMRRSLQESMETIERANHELEARVAARTNDLAAANEALRDRERARQHLLRKVISAQEEERRRIARELHDETSQSLAALGMSLELACAGADEPFARRLADVRRLVDRMHHGLHRLIVNLRPSVLDDLGLAAAIRSLAAQQLGAAGISVRCELEIDDRLPPEVETAIFRAVQEAIVNIARHARAESVLIQGEIAGGRLRIEIEDDGAGFVVEDVPKEPETMRGIGLLGMRERIHLLGGSLQVESAPGVGTRVLLSVPLRASTACGAGTPTAPEANAEKDGVATVEHRV